jgi:branched-chain amino acid transport system ATP-binding protein
MDHHGSALLEVRGLSKHYGGVKALDDVSFTLAAGQTLGVIGPNGAGKSTLLALLSGGTRPTRGSVHWRGQRIDTLPNHRVTRLGIGRARQVPRPFRRLTVRQNLEVAANAAIGDANRRAQVIDSTLQDCGLHERRHASAGSLGLLDLKRLEVARALAVEPRLLLLDEVAGGLMGPEVEAIAALIERIQARGIAIVIVEHVQGVIGRLADRALVLDWGSVIAEGTPAAVAADEAVVRVYFGDPVTAHAHGGTPVTTARAQPQGATVLETRDLSVRYGGLNALSGVNLRLHEGEVVGIIGANGAGKTTLCRAIAGLVPTAGGTVRLFDQDASAQPAHRRARSGLAICHEGRRLFTGLTVEENLMLGAAFSGASAAQTQARLDQVLQMFPILRERAQGLAGAMSGGQQQMLAIGRALMSGPRVLLLDELSLGLAPLVIESIYQALAGVRALGVSVLLVEQNTHRCLAVSDRVYVLERGRIAYDGTPDGLLGNDLLRQAYFGAAH